MHSASLAIWNRVCSRDLFAWAYPTSCLTRRAACALRWPISSAGITDVRSRYRGKANVYLNSLRKNLSRSTHSLLYLLIPTLSALTDLPHTQANKYFKLGNPGFRWEYQLIDVGDFQGIGEMAPSRYFLQNLGEAEYLVAVYMYMRLLGYPAERITFLTTYQGQKALLNDVVRNRCGSHPFFGMPAQVSWKGGGREGAGPVWKNGRARSAMSTVEF